MGADTKRFSAKGTLALYPSYVGMGLFLAWTVGNSFVLNFEGTAAIEHARTVDLLCAMGTNVLALFVIACRSNEIGSLLARRPVPLAAAACASLGSALMVLAGVLPGEALAVIAAGSCLRGVGSALLFMLWSELFSSLPIKQTSICYSAAYLISVLLEAGMRSIDANVTLVLECFLPLASAILMGIPLAGHAPDGGEGEREPARAWAFPYRPLALTMAYTFAAFFFHSAISSEAGGFSWVGGGAVSALCLAASLLFVKRFDASKLQNVALPLMIAGILLWVLLGNEAGSAVMMLTDAGNIAFRIFILVMICNICYRYQVPALWLFAIVRMAMLVAEAAGVGTGMALAANRDATSDLAVEGFAFALVLVLATVSAFATNAGRNLADTSWHIVPRESGRTSRADQLAQVMGGYEMLVWRCAKVARLYGLTHREEEVLGCLTKGMTKTQVQEDLCISEGTARTHIQHVYKKLGVHSREEMIDIVEQVE
ncbi:helix-turn-helix transcriptional regulator [Gordonibacter massiliensis (ex Traore et al. 2017)]|uniref:helix-turn-helix transcriptional regulator n=1 Tax=Gordonibacter massiliensis (ex Traore et al. 2017) TaxID=1841863 RepID=UPI001C8BBD29|nr:helix-turn-helix transcriptional regulator [Gordonibacter massiliensis (ex Traore et al. 2017)]MBX9034902.1 helix-turn-helix transcriptional regulator [Gordonibacter massiliensis (ex Traore et al. 2017)]